MENFQHHTRNLGLIRQAFRHHGPWEVTEMLDGEDPGLVYDADKFP